MVDVLSAPSWTPAGTNPQRAALGLGRYLLDDTTAQTAAAFVDQLAAGRPLPAYGSPEWLRAPRDLQVAACICAAEARRRELMFAGQALADELAADAHLEQLRDDEEFRVIAAGVRAMGAGGHCTHAQLQVRRAQVTRPTREAAA